MQNVSVDLPKRGFSYLLETALMNKQSTAKYHVGKV
jgi:hypothetical protein